MIFGVQRETVGLTFTLSVVRATPSVVYITLSVVLTTLTVVNIYSVGFYTLHRRLQAFTLSVVRLLYLLYTLSLSVLLTTLSVVNIYSVGCTHSREFKIGRLRTTNYGWTSLVLCL